jgi:hypothetical protein
MLQYHTVDNLMTPAPNDYMAQTVNVRSYNEPQIVEQMLRRGTSLTKTDLLAVNQLRTEVILDLLADGAAVNTSLCNISPSISGVFEGATDSFDASRHKVNINIYANTATRDAAKRIKVEKVQVADPSPYIVEAKDVVSGTVNETLTPGGILELRGSRLKFAAANPANGLFLIPETGGEIRMEVIAENKPARLMALLPAQLAAGTYYAEVRTTVSQGNAKESKQLKTGRFARPLTV